MAKGSPSRWEDVFQDEIISEVPHDSFKRFARSRAGLGLSNGIVNEIYREAGEWKIKLLLKWQKMNPEATPDTIRSRANNFMTLRVNEEVSDTGPRKERFEDVFQDEIVKIVPHDEFKEFARSKVGLCLSEHDVDDIIHDFPKASEQRIQMLFKWKSKQAEPTPDTIRQIARKYISPDIDNEFADPESQPLTETLRIMKYKTLGASDWIYEGKQKTHRGSRKVAIKLLKWDEKTMKEADILMDVGSDRNIVQFIASDRTQQGIFDYLYIAMELCHEKNLHQHIFDHDERFDHKTAYSRAHGLVSGLKYIHSKKITHRDLKPHNILLTLDLKHVKISDFGLSKVIPTGHSRLTASKSFVGTDGYRAPEAYAHNHFSEKGDVFSLGLVIHFIWSDGRHAYGSKPYEWNTKIVKNLGLDLSQIKVPQSDHKQAVHFLKCLLRYDPLERPSASDIEKGANEDEVPSIHHPCLKMQPEDQILLIIKPTEDYTLSVYSLAPRLQSKEYNEVKLDKVMDAQEFKNNRYTSVAVGDFLYILGWNGFVYKASFCSSDQSWRKLDNAMLFLHGRWPLAVVIGDKIYLCGGGWNDKGVVDVRKKDEMPDSTTACEILDTTTDEFSTISDMLFSRRYHAMAASELSMPLVESAVDWRPNEY